MGPFLVKNRKKGVKEDYLNLQIVNRDYEDAVAMIQFEIQIQLDEVEKAKLRKIKRGTYPPILILS